MGDVVQFLVALLGVLLVGITPNPPVTFRDWLQIVAGAALTAAMTTAAVRDWVRRSASRALDSGPADRLRDWRLWAWVLATVLVAVVVAVTVPWLVDGARGLSYRVLGCPPAVQLRVLAEPETVATTRELAGRYERWTADGNHGCPTAQAYVFAAEPATIADKVATTDGWSDATDSLRAVGPRPDVWLASTRREVDAATTAGGAVAESLPVAHSPLVLAVPAGALRPTGTWPQVFRQLEKERVAVVRPDPRTTQVGRLATVLLYGRDTAYPDAARSLAVERSLDAARGTLPIGGAAELLCPRRTAVTGAATPPSSSPPSRTSHATTRARRSARRAVRPRAARRRTSGSRPSTRTTPPTRTCSSSGCAGPIRYRCRNGPRRRSGAGCAATPAAVPSWRPGCDPPGSSRRPRRRSPATTASTPRWPRPRNRSPSSSGRTPTPPTRRPSCPAGCSSSSTRPARWAGWCRAAPRRHRAAPVPPWSADAVGAGLAGLQPGDEFGLWLFPGGTPDAYTEAVPVGLRDEGLATARDALARVQPGGGTPLFRAVTDGVTALSASDEAASGERIGTRALVVLTDGRDNASGTVLDDVRDRVTGRGVRIVVVALGGVRCAEAGLATLADETGGECVESDPADVPGRVQEFVTQLRGGQS